MIESLPNKIGLISDSHSNNKYLIKAIELLKENGADTIVHLGDICDSMKPETMDDSVDILKKANAIAILGNNEYKIKTEYIPNNQDAFKKDTVSFINDLPYNLVVDDICFTHSLPYEWPAATHQPLENFIKFPLVDDMFPFRILFRGHSHSMSIVEIQDGQGSNVASEDDGVYNCSSERKYIITVGALEDGFCALFDIVNNKFYSFLIL